MSSAPMATQGNANTSTRQQGPQPPDVLMQMALGFMATAALGCVGELEIAERLKHGPQSAAQLAAETGVKEAPLYRMLRALASGGVFVESAPRVFALTPAAELLCRGAK